jgi:hypothetical protein
MKQLILLIMPLIALVTSCKKAQPPMSVLNQGCDCATEVSAAFTIEEIGSIINPEQYVTETDLVFGNKNVRFYAKENNAEYTWYIGSEIINTREVKRYFSNSLVGQTIPISLVVKKKPNLICFPFDDGYDSITNYFTVAQLSLYENYDTTFLEGAYRMKSPLLTDSVDIVIDYKLYAGGMNRCFDFYNYDGEGNNLFNKIISFNWNGITYRQLWFEDLGGWLNHLQGDVHIRMDNVVEMNFIEKAWNGSTLVISKEYKYRGRKL